MEFKQVLVQGLYLVLLDPIRDGYSGDQTGVFLNRILGTRDRALATLAEIDPRIGNPMLKLDAGYSESMANDAGRKILPRAADEFSSFLALSQLDSRRCERRKLLSALLAPEIQPS